MTITAAGTGSQTAVIGTEHSLLSVNTAGTYVLHVNAINMAAGDLVELRIKQIILTGGTAAVAYYQAYTDAQPADDMIKISVPISNELTDTGSLVFTLKQTLGTGRVFDWKVLKFA